MERDKALAVMAPQTEMTTHEIIARAGTLPKGMQQRVVGEVRRMAAQAAVAQGAATAIAATQSHVRDVLIRDRQESRARFAEIEEQLSDDEKEAWRELERASFAAGINAAHHAVEKIAETEAAVELPDQGFAYEDWTFSDRLKNAATLGGHRLHRQGIERDRFRQPLEPSYQKVILTPIPAARSDRS